jgi:parallel beta-helix repeat protein
MANIIDSTVAEIFAGKEFSAANTVPTVSGNTVVGEGSNPPFGISVATNNAVVSNNAVLKVGIGINIAFGAGDTVSSNHISDHTFGVLLGGSTPNITNNVITRNTLESKLIASLRPP